MALRNVALLITNDNRQGIMETIIVLLALLSQILGLFNVAHSPNFLQNKLMRENSAFVFCQ